MAVHYGLYSGTAGTLLLLSGNTASMRCSRKYALSLLALCAGRAGWNLQIVMAGSPELLLLNKSRKIHSALFRCCSCANFSMHQHCTEQRCGDLSSWSLFESSPSASSQQTGNSACSASRFISAFHELQKITLAVSLNPDCRST